MKTLLRLITIVLFTAFMISLGSCGSRSGELAKAKRVQESFDAIVVINSTGVFKSLNDTVALRFHDNSYFYRKMDNMTNRYRYYLAK